MVVISLGPPLAETLLYMQLQKHLSDEGHPYHKFSTGQWYI